MQTNVVEVQRESLSKFRDDGDDDDIDDDDYHYDGDDLAENRTLHSVSDIRLPSAGVSPAKRKTRGKSKASDW